MGSFQAAAADIWELLLQQNCCITQHINTLKLHKPTRTRSKVVLDGWRGPVLADDGEKRAEGSEEKG